MMDNKCIYTVPCRVMWLIRLEAQLAAPSLIDMSSVCMQPINTISHKNYLKTV